MTRWIRNRTEFPDGCFGTYTYDFLSPEEFRAWAASGPVESKLADSEEVSFVEEIIGGRLTFSKKPLIMLPGDSAVIVKNVGAGVEIGLLSRIR